MSKVNITAEQAVGAIEIVARQVVTAIFHNVDKYGDWEADTRKGVVFKMPLTIQVLNVVNEWEKYPVMRIYIRPNVGVFLESLNDNQNDQMLTHDRLLVDDLVKILAQVQQAGK